MSERQALEGYDQVVRRIKFTETHPHVQIDHVAAPYWHWTATWVNRADRQVTKTHHELRGLIDGLDAVDWDTEWPRRQPPKADRPPDGDADPGAA